MERTYTITCTEKQLRMIDTALEEWMRVRMGQFEDLADYLAFKGFDYNAPHDDKRKFDFDRKIENRENARLSFKRAFEFAQPERWRDHSQLYKNDAEMLCEDLWAIIRHELWLADDRPEKPQYTTDSFKPIIWSKDATNFHVSHN